MGCGVSWTRPSRVAVRSCCWRGRPHWADPPSQLLLDFLARRLPVGAVAVVGSYRDTEPTPGPAPGPALASLAARTTVLPLTGLSRTR